MSELNQIISDCKQRYYQNAESDRLKRVREFVGCDYYQSTDNPRVFVYTPTYNRADILKSRAMSSVLNQTHTNFVYMVVGDGCNDQTEEVVRQCNDPRVRFVNIPKRGWRYPPTAKNHWLVGPVVAANVALSLVDGDWIARIDDDDVWVEDHLERMLKLARSGDLEFVSGKAEVTIDGGSYVGGGDHLFGEYFRIDRPHDRDDDPIIGGHSSWVYRSYLNFFEYNIDCWRKDHNQVNDCDLAVRMGLAGVRMGFSDEVSFRMSPRPGEQEIGSRAYVNNADHQESKYNF